MSASAQPDGREHLAAAGGLLAGAALAALARAIAPLGPAQPWAVLALAAAALALARASAPASAARAASAPAGALLAAALPFFAFATPLHSALAATMLLVATYALGARGPASLLGAAAFFTTARHATQVDLMGHDALAPAFAFFVLLAGYGTLLLHLPATPWRSRLLALQAVALLLSLFPLLDALGVRDASIAALAAGALLAALFAAGVGLGERALAGTAGALLACAALVLALLAVGPLLAAVTLLASAAGLLWLARGMRAAAPSAGDG